MASPPPTPPPPGLIGRRRFDWGARTFLMGVINCTEDSFSGDGLRADADAAVRQGLRMLAEGADLLDVGAESTRPGFKPVSAELELARVVPVIERLARETDAPVSVDSTKAGVVRAALAAGATVVIMHNQRNRPFHDVAADIREGLLAGCAVAERAGIPRERLILDPGFGFGWRPEHSIEMLRRLGELRDLGRPLLVGTSRKSAIGAVLGLPVEERLLGTAATVAMAIANGADIVRVHDVKEMAQVARMTDAVVRGWRPPPTVLLGVGGNLGDRLAHLRRGVALLAPEVTVAAASALYESAPWGVTDQPPFLNAALRVETRLSPHDLLAKCKAVEAAAGRTPGRRWGPRVLDLDILLYGDLRLDDEALTLPHPRIAERGFVLRPLADLAPEIVPPGWRRSVGAALAEIGEEGLRRVAGPEWAPGPGPTRA